jgi:hypothetical protein
MLFLSVGVLVILAFDVWKAFWFTDPATGAVSFGVGVGTLLLAVNTVLLGGICSAAIRCVTSWAAASTSCRGADGRAGVFLRELPQPPAHGVGVDQPVAVAFADLYVRLSLHGRRVGRQIF